MACEKRQRTGSCSHNQCPYPLNTEHGYECIEIVAGFCEVGEGCYGGCSHAWATTDQVTAKRAEKAFKAAYPD